jgi:hypothetical protein
MSTSSYFMDVSAQYQNNGCPSQCMGMNEYTTIPDMYSFGTDPKTALLSAGPSTPYGGSSNTLMVSQPISQPTVQSVSQPTVQPQGDLFGDVMSATNGNQLTNLSTAYGIQDPNMNYRENFGAFPTGLVYPVSGSIKNRVSTRLSPLEREARIPSQTFGYEYPKMMPQAFVNDTQKVQPVHLRVPRS